MRHYNLISIINISCGLIVTLISLIVLIGWIIHSNFLIQVNPSLPSMQFNTALCFLLCGYNLLFLDRANSGIIIIIIAIIIGTIALITGSQYVFDTNYGIDTLFVKPLAFVHITHPGRMAPNTALNFIFVSLTFLIIAKHGKSTKTYVVMIVALLGSLVIALGLVPLLAYLAGIESATSWGGFTQMAIMSAICFIFIGFGISLHAFKHPDILPALLPVPVFIGMLTAVLSFSSTIKVYEDNQFKSYIQSEALDTANTYVKFLNTLYSSLSHIRKRWEIQGGTSKEWWEKDAETYIHDYTSLRILFWVNKQFQISWIIPKEKYKNYIGYDYYSVDKSDTERTNTINKAILSHAAQTTKINNLSFGDVWNSFQYINPLFVNKQFDGLLIAVIDVNQSFDNLFKQRLYKNYFLSVTEDGIPIFNNLPKDIIPAQKWSQSASAEINGRTWKFTLTPTQYILKNTSSNVPTIVLVTGVLISLITVLAIFSSLKAKKNAQALVISEGRLQAIMDASHHSVISTNIDGTIQLFNPAAERMLGYTADEMIGKQTPVVFHSNEEMIARTQKLNELLGTEIKPGFATFIAKLNQQEVDEQEWTYVRKDSSTFPVWLSISALHNSNNEVVGYVGIAQDISERKALDTMKNEFISVVSHELRTPLTSIRGSLSLLVGGAMGVFDDKIIKLLNIAYSNCERLIRLINDILDIEKIEAGKMKFQLTTININDLAEGVVAENQAYAQKFDVSLELLKAPSTIFVKADSDRLIQVLTNLISNAVKASPKNKTVILKITSQNDKAIFAIIDEGPGIPIEFQKRIFQKFTQADSTTGHKQAGTGLGLSISKAIIDKLGGKIYFTTKLNEGTTFYVELPICENDH